MDPQDVGLPPQTVSSELPPTPVVSQPSVTKRSPLSLIILGLSLLILGSSIGYYLRVSWSSLVPSTATPRRIPSPTTNPDSTASWKTHIDQLLGFSIKYPSGWYIWPTTASPDQGGTTILSNVDINGPMTEDPYEGYKKGKIKIDFGYHPQPYNGTQDLTEWLKQNFIASGPTSDASVSAQQDVRIGQYIGKRIEYTETTHQGKFAWIIFAIPRNDKVFLISGGPAAPVVDQIFSTFKFTDQSAQPISWKTYTHDTCGTTLEKVTFELQLPAGWTESVSHTETISTYTHKGAEGQFTVQCGVGFGGGGCPEEYIDIDVGEKKTKGCLVKLPETNTLNLVHTGLITPRVSFSFEASLMNTPSAESLLRQILATFKTFD